MLMDSKDIFPDIYDDMTGGFATYDAFAPGMSVVSAAYQAYSATHGIDAGAYLAAETFSERMSGFDMDAIMGNMSLMYSELVEGMGLISSLYPVSDSWPLEQALGIMADRHFHLDFDGLSSASRDQIPDEIDINVLCKAAAKAVSSERAEDKDSLAERIISGYEQEITADKGDEKAEAAAKPDRSVVEFFLEKILFPLIIELIILSISNALSGRVPETDVYNDITVINNYYVNESRLDAAVLRAFNWRLVCRDSMVRVRPDRKSTVVAKLKLGQPVQVISKNRKWREIRWNDGKTMLSGWIQNYRLRGFREC